MSAQSRHLKGGGASAHSNHHRLLPHSPLSPPPPPPPTWLTCRASHRFGLCPRLPTRSTILVFFHRLIRNSTVCLASIRWAKKRNSATIHHHISEHGQQQEQQPRAWRRRRRGRRRRPSSSMELQVEAALGGASRPSELNTSSCGDGIRLCPCRVRSL
jgi:hypothetical protein